MNSYLAPYVSRFHPSNSIQLDKHLFIMMTSGFHIRPPCIRRVCVAYVSGSHISLLSVQPIDTVVSISSIWSSCNQLQTCLPGPTLGTSLLTRGTCKQSLLHKTFIYIETEYAGKLSSKMKHLRVVISTSFTSLYTSICDEGMWSTLNERLTELLEHRQFRIRYYKIKY